MERREFTAFVTTCACWPCVVLAQCATRPLRVGVVSAANSRTMTFWTVFLQRMQALGYVEGRNFVFVSAFPQHSSPAPMR